jgi:S-adenosylmethionine hydrolase
VRIVTLLSDFGTSSPYPAQVRAALLTRCRAALVDITHEVPPHDVRTGAVLLAEAAPQFPAGTVHLAVVDPGVGTDRAPLAIAAGGHFLVGPDNGLLVPAARSLGPVRAVAIEAARVTRVPVPATFHGRDLFAPAAALLVTGWPLDALGSAARSPVDLEIRPPARDRGALRGEVLYVDPFGNVITNIPGWWLDALPDSVRLKLGPGRAAARIRRVRTYGEGRRGDMLALVGSAGGVEIAVREGRAADRLRLRAGAAVELEPAQAPSRNRPPAGRVVGNREPTGRRPR